MTRRGRPPNLEPHATVSSWFSPGQYDRVVAEAKRRDQSISQTVRELVIGALDAVDEQLETAVDLRSLELLGTSLEVMEEVVLKADLADPRTARSWLRHMDLTDALQNVRDAREEFARRPHGARLALLWADACVARVRFDIEAAMREREGHSKGAHKANGPRQQRAAEDQETIRGLAEKLDPELPATKKASIVKKRLSSPLSESRLRHIIKKNLATR